MIAALIAGLSFTAPHVQDPLAGRIVFVSDRDGNNEIYSMRADGSALKRLTNNLGSDIEPCFSEDGRKIFWASNRGGAYHIWSMNWDGSNQAALTSTKGYEDRYPMWSKTAKRVLFVSNKRFYMVRPDGTEVFHYLNLPVEQDCQPSVSPAALELAFRSQTGHLITKEDGEFFRDVPLTYGKNGVPERVNNPSWSQDGRSIIFDSGGATAKIFTLDTVDRSCDPVSMEGFGADPVFAKQDTAAVFTGPTGVGNGSDIYIIDLDAGMRTHGLPKPVNLTHSPGKDFNPSYWEPEAEE